MKILFDYTALIVNGQFITTRLLNGIKVSARLYARTVKYDSEVSMEVSEFSELIEIFGRDWCRNLHKDDILMIIGSLQINPVYIYE